ncbi:hypothetical protein N431DRAFT_387394 [Stipitochalara longipes BDJ]|nr:hypothetical protein N431DRAFT_387394 [Stipitochalara longipes BDJ]
MKYSLMSWVLIGLTCPLSLALASSRPQSSSNTKTIPAAAVTGDVTANFESECSLDGSQLSAVNNSSWDWWYFDAVSPDAKSNVVVVFFTASSMGFPFVGPSEDVTRFEIHALLPNGTLFNALISAEEAVITTVGEGSSGDFKGTNASWTGTPDLKYYKIEVNSPANGVFGTFNLRSVAPGHYPCGPVRSGENIMVTPEIGWANAVPDAVADVDFTLGGTKLAFEGVGYHDKNWSNQPFTSLVASWYWGHGRLGDYSIVWFDTLGADGNEYVSSYVSKHDKIIVSNCDAGSIKVRPSGVNSTYPPTVSTGNPGGFTIKIDLGTEGTMNVDVTATAVTLQGANLYTEWIGSINGSVNGGVQLTGVALFEMFKLAT